MSKKKFYKILNVTDGLYLNQGGYSGYPDYTTGKPVWKSKGRTWRTLDGARNFLKQAFKEVPFEDLFSGKRIVVVSYDPELSKLHPVSDIVSKIRTSGAIRSNPWETHKFRSVENKGEIKEIVSALADSPSIFKIVDISNGKEYSSGYGSDWVGRGTAWKTAQGIANALLNPFGGYFEKGADPENPWPKTAMISISKNSEVDGTLESASEVFEDEIQKTLEEAREEAAQETIRTIESTFESIDWDIERLVESFESAKKITIPSLLTLDQAERIKNMCVEMGDDLEKSLEPLRKRE